MQRPTPRGRLRIELPPTATVRSVVDLVCERYPGAKPIARRERNRSDRSLDDLRNLLGERLTDRQFEVIETAYHAGYYEWPHDVSSAETAELLGITQPTFAEHFWTAQRHIIDLLLETDADR
jgi:predicted DNA binding protein